MELSYMASTVGRPIVLDKTTYETCHDQLGCIGFARILIKVDASHKLSELIRIKIPMGENWEPRILEVHVSCQWRRQMFGHADESCLSLPKVVENNPVGDSSKVPQGDKEGFIKVNCKGKGKAVLKPSVVVSSSNQIVISSNPADPLGIPSDIASPSSNSKNDSFV
ncbi:hypothetical protein Pint_30192 [Pistacia integerrima]|uniref:Uncharacterized protein n=1 Tax=Pistacia integerrima TaxID=434235 RepID=A0ACC0X125_9ROSI|nr:hypothetical protein Pint_30192 [Pistacia integerrima]